jgi:two-component system, OmpR family, response regulator
MVVAAPDRLGAAGPGRRRPPISASPWLQPPGLRVLVADEDAAARESLASVVGAGVSTTVCDNGAEALWQAGRVEPVVVILSASLPVVSAADVASVLSRHGDGRGVVVVSVAFGEADKAGPVLAAGAGGVVSRPYRSAEIEPLLRTYLSELEEGRRDAEVLTAGDLELDGPAFEARAAGRPLRLTLREFELLRLLMLHAGGVVSPERIRQEIWAARGETVTSNTISVHVRHLRRHLQGSAEIVTIRRVGYRLSVSAGATASPSATVGLQATGT